MFGQYDVPLHIERDDLTISLQQERESLVYKRRSGGEEVSKKILSDNPNIFIMPVEPLNKPKEISPYLLIEFEEPLVVEPDTTERIFITYPVEMGIFISKDKQQEIIDFISLSSPKFSLYGDPRAGVICKYWKSKTFSSTPALNPVLEGVLDTTIANPTDEWVTMTKAVFNAYGMKIYYSDSMVSMKATIEVRTGGNAETTFIDAPLQTGMNKAIEVYAIRALSMTTTKFVMEMGL